MIRIYITLAALALATPAFASDPASPAPETVPAPEAVVTAATSPDAVGQPTVAETDAADLPVMSEDDLGDVAGQGVEVNVLTDQDLTAVNSGNIVNADVITNGSINFTQGALSGFSGVGNFVSNTGNNNNLQGSISVTVINTADLP